MIVNVLYVYLHYSLNKNLIKSVHENTMKNI